MGIHDLFSEVEIQPRINRYGIETITFGTSGNIILPTDMSEVYDWTASGSFDVNWEIGFAVGGEFARRRDTVLEDFDVGRESTVVTGVYHSNIGLVTASTPSVWPISVSATGTFRDFFGGTLLGGEATLSLRPIALVRFDITAQYNNVTFPDDRPDFDSVVTNGRLTFSFTPRLTWDTFVSSNTVIDLVRIQSRVRWTYGPGSDIFLVVQQDFRDDDFRVDFASLLLKLTYRWPDVERSFQ